MDEINKQLNKLKYQMQLVGESLNSIDHPIATLVITFDWDDDDLNKAHDIFEKFDRQLEKNEKINWMEFEKDFQDYLYIGYQELKLIVLSFYRNYQWLDVCIAYAKKHECVEFHQITRDVRN